MEPELTESEALPKAKPAPTPAEPAPQGRRGFGLRHMMAAIVAIALLLWLVRAMGVGFFLLMLLLTPPVMLMSLVVVLIRRRSAQRDGMLWVIATAAKRGMPLGPGVEAYAALCSGRYRAKATVLGQMLDSGVSLPEAVARVPGVLPPDAALLAHVGWDSGTLAEALTDASAARATRRPALRALVLRIAYFCGMLIFVQTVGWFILYFIAPKFEAIFADFGARLPPITIRVIQGGNFIGRGPILPLLYLAEFAVLMYLPLSYFGYFSGGLADWLLGPFLTFRRRHTATILRALGVCTLGGRPLTEGLVTLARYYPQGAIRRRLVRVYHDLQAGADWIAALRRRGLIRRSDAALLDAAQRVGNLPWALRELADGIERRIAYRMMGLVQLLFPVVVLALGVLVFLVAVAYFLPLVDLIDELSGRI